MWRWRRIRGVYMKRKGDEFLIQTYFTLILTKTLRLTQTEQI